MDLCHGSEWQGDAHGNFAKLHLRPLDVYGVGGGEGIPARSVLDDEIIVEYGLGK